MGGLDYFCRRIDTELELSEKSNEPGAKFRQQILAPAGEGVCFNMEDQESLWSKRLSVGTIEGKFEFGPSEVRVSVEEEIDEEVDW